MLDGTTWNITSAPNTLNGSVSFQATSGPLNGAITLNYGQMESQSGTYAENPDGSVIISIATFMAGGDPVPPFGIPTINADGQNGNPIPVVWFGKYSGKQAMMYCSNTQTPCVQGFANSVVQAFQLQMQD